MEKIVLAHNHYDKEHLAEVVKEMKILGAPTIRVFDLGFDGLSQAIEGCHRLRACEVLGIAPDLVYLDKDIVRADVENWDFEDGEMPESSTLESVGDWENYQIWLHPDGRALTVEEKEDY